MKVWLVGDQGMLGTAMKAELEARGIPFSASDAELDITDPGALVDFAERGRFSHVLNCAAYTDVDGAEEHEETATRVNGEGPGNLWRAAQASGARLLHISTDYVFDGSAHTPYPEDSATAPINAYGRSKLAGERAILQAPGSGSAQAYIVRTSWLFGPFGKSFVTTMLRLMGERTELRVVSDQLGRPTYCPDLARACLELVGLSGRRCAPGLYHFANSGQCSWHEFATEILSLAKQCGIPTKTESIAAITTAEFPTPAKRPAFSVLDTTQIERALGEKPRAWQTALGDFIRLLAQ